MYKENAILVENDISPTVPLSNICTFLHTNIVFLHCLGSKLFCHWCSGFSINSDETSANCKGTDLDASPSNPSSMRRSFCGDLFYFVSSLGVVFLCVLEKTIQYSVSN